MVHPTTGNSALTCGTWGEGGGVGGTKVIYRGLYGLLTQVVG